MQCLGMEKAAEMGMVVFWLPFATPRRLQKRRAMAGKGSGPENIYQRTL